MVIRDFFATFRSWAIRKYKKTVSLSAQKPGLLWFLQITQDLIKMKKNLEHHFVDIGKWETCA